MSVNHNLNMNAEKNIYAILDQVAETGIPVTLKRKGNPITISRAIADSKLDRIEDHLDFLQVDPNDVVHVDWSDEWNSNL